MSHRVLDSISSATSLTLTNILAGHKFTITLWFSLPAFQYFDKLMINDFDSFIGVNGHHPTSHAKKINNLKSGIVESVKSPMNVLQIVVESFSR